jgi:ABC-2 type transport system ATP-binding protein
MVAGELVAQGTPSDLKAQQKGHVIELITDAPQRANNLLKSQMESWQVSLFGDRLHVVMEEDSENAIRHVTDQLARAGIHVMSAGRVPYSLEDVFIAIVEKMRKEGKSAQE